MTKPHRATPEQWESIERYAATNGPYSCFLELRARIEALEELHKAVVDLNERFNLDPLVERVEALERTQQQPPLFSADSLGDRVAKAIVDAPVTEAGWHSEARAAILEVAAWLREHTLYSATSQIAADLEYEANR